MKSCCWAASCLASTLGSTGCGCGGTTMAGGVAGGQAGRVSAMAELPAPCPLCPPGGTFPPLAPACRPPLAPRRDLAATVQSYLGPAPWLASWAWVPASWLAGSWASAPSLGTLRGQGPPTSVPTRAPRQPPSSPRQGDEHGPEGCGRELHGKPGPCLPPTWAGRPRMGLSPALTHGVAALLHGPHGTPSLHAATQSPALLQILRRQRSQARRSERES